MKFKMVIGGLEYWCVDFITSAAAWEYKDRIGKGTVKKVLHPNGDFYRVIIDRV